MSRIYFHCLCGNKLDISSDKEIDEYSCDKCKRKFRRYYDASYDLYTWDEVKDEGW